MAAHIPQAVGDRQFGGVRRRGTQHASVVTRMLQTAATANMLPFAAIFMDVKNAFYSMVRELVLRAPMAKADKDAIAESTAVPTTALEILKRRLEEEMPLLHRTEASEHLKALVEEQYTASWFVCESSDHVALGT
eukprot:5584817-Pyramimonas_sp.AAC.1